MQQDIILYESRESTKTNRLETSNINNIIINTTKNIYVFELPSAAVGDIAKGYDVLVFSSSSLTTCLISFFALFLKSSFSALSTQAAHQFLPVLPDDDILFSLGYTIYDIKNML